MQYIVTGPDGKPERTVFTDAPEMAAGWAKCVWEEKGITVRRVPYAQTFTEYVHARYAQLIQSVEAQLARLGEEAYQTIHYDRMRQSHRCHISRLEGELATIDPFTKHPDSNVQYGLDQYRKHYLMEIERMWKADLFTIADTVLAETFPEWLVEQQKIRKLTETDPGFESWAEAAQLSRSPQSLAR
jgi:hypothetical protein